MLAYDADWFSPALTALGIPRGPTLDTSSFAPKKFNKRVGKFNEWQHFTDFRGDYFQPT